MAWAIGFFPIVGKETRRPHCARRRVSERNRRKAAALSAEMAAEFPLRKTDESEPCPLIRPAHWGTFPPIVGKALGLLK